MRVPGQKFFVPAIVFSFAGMAAPTLTLTTLKYFKEIQNDQSLCSIRAQRRTQTFRVRPRELKPMEVEIDVHYCGICHSDLSVIDSEWGKSAYPVVAGHEVVARSARSAAMSGISRLARSSAWVGTRLLQQVFAVSRG